MRERALVVSINDNFVLVRPLITDACIACSNSKSCTSSCAKPGESFSVTNPKKLNIKEGDIVRVEEQKINMIIQGFVCLLGPICSAIAGYVFAPVILEKFNKVATEGSRALFVLLGLGLSSAIVLAFNKIFAKQKSHITEIL
ncbi:MAG: SoxR reducing system RseC family protein [Treponema sp.]|nr:SoxR reducing system RseC family protein [Treponema sp.]